MEYFIPEASVFCIETFCTELCTIYQFKWFMIFFFSFNLALMLGAMFFVDVLLEQNISEFIEWLAVISIFYQHWI